MKKRLCALLAAVCLLLLISVPSQPAGASSSGTIYLLAANDKFCDLPGGVLPVAVNGTIYVPYTLFDKDATGVDLGVYYGLSQEQGTTLSLYALSGYLTFRVNMGICEDNQGNLMSFRAVIRNNIPYVPASAVCNFFGLQYSFLPTTDRGTLIRVSNSSASLSDSLFLSSAKLGMAYRYNNIIQSREPTASPAASSAPAATPTPAATPAPGAADHSNLRVYLAIDASQTTGDLTTLLSGGTKALFLFDPETLADQAELVRKAVAAGHSIGLTVSATSLTEAQEQLERGNALLSHIARVNTHIVSAPSALSSSLAAAGWKCWQSNLSATTSSALLSALNGRRSTARIQLSGSAGTVNRAITVLRQEGYILRQPLETGL